MTVEPRVLLAILGMALVTYATRASGLWLMGRVTLSPRVDAWLRYVPGTVLVALVAPGVLDSGLPGVVAALITAAVAVRSGNALLAMAAGVLAILAARILLARV
ncbi:MAG: AzlD domain-containing protein [Chloroflexi bacterium]|nr:AzlD domain-containing protein [Chloroflexota bacterium]